MSSYTQLKQLAKSIGRRLPFTITLNLAVPGTPFGFSIHRKRTHTIQAHNEPSDTLALAQLTRAEYFHTSINKTRFERGENVFFSITFRGQLRYGYYEAVIVRSDNSVDYSWDPQTLPYARAETRGTLSGPIQQDEHAWSYPLPMNSPIGPYTAHVGVYDTYLLDAPTAFRAWFLRNWFFRKIARRNPQKIAAHDRRCIAEETVKFVVINRSRPSLPS